MGLLDRVSAAFARRRDGELAWPVGPVTAPAFEGFTGHAPSYDPQVYGDYLASSADVYAAASLRARLMSGLPLQLFRGLGPERSQVTSGPAAELLRRVNPFWTLPRLLRMDELSMCIWGESIWAVEGADVNRPQEIWWCKPTQMRPVPDASNYISHWLYQPLTGGPAIRFEPNEVVWFRYPNPNDEFTSLSPLVAARLAADTGSAMMKANRNLFANGLLGGGAVVPEEGKLTFTKEQAEQLEAMIDQRYRGVDKAHRWSVMRYAARFQNLAVSPKDAEFVSGLDLTARQVWNAYGIPAPLLNDLAHATLSNTREFERQLWTHALEPDSSLRAGEITEQFLPMFSRRSGPPATPDVAEFDLSKVAALQAARTESWDRERQAIESGAMTINEWRGRQGMPPVSWGDVWWAPVNKSAVSGATSRPEGDTSPTGDQQEVEETEAAGVMAALEFGAWQMRHGPLRLNGSARLNGRPVRTGG
jgi:HK97 family phage portal protein